MVEEPKRVGSKGRGSSFGHINGGGWAGWKGWWKAVRWNVIVPLFLSFKNLKIKEN